MRMRLLSFCLIISIGILGVSCTKQDSSQLDNNDKAVSTSTSISTPVNNKAESENESEKAESNIDELKEVIQSKDIQINSLEKDRDYYAELLKSVTKTYTYKDKISLAKKFWYYKLRINDTPITDSLIEVNEPDFKIALTEGHEGYGILPGDILNTGKISGKTKEHIKFIGYKYSNAQEPAGGFVWGYVYEFKNVPMNTSFKIELSKELQDRLGLRTNILDILVREKGTAKATSVDNIGLNQVDEYKKFIKDSLKIGMSSKEVIKYLGDSFKEVPSGDPPPYFKYVWRYDILSQSGYLYKNVIDDVDVEGLTSGEVKIILFVSYSENDTVVNYSIYYLNPNDNKVYVYGVSKDSLITETKIN